MAVVLEERYLGPSGSPVLADGFRWEPANRRVRAVFNGETVADSTRVMLLIEFGRLPVFYFPKGDVRMDLLAPSDHHTTSPLKGEASYYTLTVGDRVAENAAWTYHDAPAEGLDTSGYMAFYWSKMDAWYEEDQQVFGHARDPYKRIDVLPSSRHVRIVLGGETVADTHRPHLLLETGLPTRYYIPRDDVRMELLSPSSTTSRCPYKGEARYWSVDAGGKHYEDAVWSYPTPLPESQHIAGLLCFYNERVDAIYVDDELVPTPHTIFS